MSISPNQYELRVYIDHSTEGHTVVVLINSSAISQTYVLYYCTESWERHFTNQWMREKKHLLEWALMEYRYVMNKTVKLLHYSEARSST